MLSRISPPSPKSRKYLYAKIWNYTVLDLHVVVIDQIAINHKVIAVYYSQMGQDKTIAWVNMGVVCEKVKIPPSIDYCNDCSLSSK